MLIWLKNQRKVRCRTFQLRYAPRVPRVAAGETLATGYSVASLHPDACGWSESWEKCVGQGCADDCATASGGLHVPFGWFPLARTPRTTVDGYRCKAVWATTAGSVCWVANKSFEISKFKFNISESSNLRTSQGSFSAVSKPNFASKYRWKALSEIYTMHSFAPFSNVNFFVKNY